MCQMEQIFKNSGIEVEVGEKLDSINYYIPKDYDLRKEVSDLMNSLTLSSNSNSIAEKNSNNNKNYFSNSISKDNEYSSK